MKKLILACIVFSILSTQVFALGLTTASGKKASDFTDIPAGAWYYDEVDTLIRSGGINGLPDGSFSPERVITLAQFIKLVSALTLSIPAAAGEEWYSAYVSAAETEGLLDGLDQTRKLNLPITRYDMALIMVNTAKFLGENLVPLDGAQRQISDYKSIPENYQKSVILAYCAGLVTGRTNGTFDGEVTLKRCEAAAVVVRLFDKSSRVVVAGYDYSMPVPESKMVSNEFFANSLFLGNSLAEGFRLYSGLKSGMFSTSVGMTVYSAESKISSVAGCSSVYIMLGINEIGYGTSAVTLNYRALIAKIRAINPEIDVYVESVLPVCESMLSTSQKQYHITNSYINELNSALKTMCKDDKVFFIDIHSAIADDVGTLPSYKSWDGVHLTPDVYKIWLEYLKSHVA